MNGAFPQRTNTSTFALIRRLQHHLTLTHIVRMNIGYSCVSSIIPTASNGNGSPTFSPGLSIEHPCSEKLLEFYCWSSHTSEYDIHARQRHIIYSQRKTEQRSSWPATIAYTPMNSVIFDRCRVPLVCSELQYNHDVARFQAAIVIGEQK
jgi:hypothetical protein